ncbi:HTH_Tnp_Tc3_2 domain-containing protein [Trichonephila clavipes]|nr:HTH_Tnp_Tc3_2 domain-containing protein [Trichonephila clavipes]
MPIPLGYRGRLDGMEDDYLSMDQRNSDGLREGGFSFPDIVEGLGRNVLTVHDCWEQWSKNEIRAAVGTTVKQRTVRNWSLRGQLRAKRPVVCISLLQLCQARAHWRMEWISVVFFSVESRFCLGACDGRVLVRSRPGEYLQPNCLWPRPPGEQFPMIAGELSRLSQTH